MGSFKEVNSICTISLYATVVKITGQRRLFGPQRTETMKTRTTGKLNVAFMKVSVFTC